MKIRTVSLGIALCFCIMIVNQYAHSESNKPRPVTGASNASKSNLPPIVRLNKSSVSDSCLENYGSTCISAIPAPLIEGEEYRGSCPVKLNFDWSIVSSQPTVVTYRFQKSDGSSASAIMKVNLPKGNTPVDVTAMWIVGANTPEFRNYKGWIDLSTLTPNVFGKKIYFVLRCNQGN